MIMEKRSQTSSGIAEIRSVILKFLNSRNVFIRVIIPYILFIFVNVSLVRLGISCVMILIIFDLLMGLYLFDKAAKREEIIETLRRIKEGDFKAKIDTEYLYSDNLRIAESVNLLGDVIKNAVEVSMKDEKLKADLITNVSHDLKTPLTSIINYVELIKREDVENERIKKYIDVLQGKSYRLKKLTEDLLEASKISSGNIKVDLTRINLVEFVNQTIGEYYEKFEDASLTPIFKHKESVACVDADPRHLWRVIENLFGNACKYALPGTAVSISISESDDSTKLIISNVSKTNIGLEDYELDERFTRGDASRSTEGTGLGLAIAKSLVKAQGAKMEIKTCGDLFKCIIMFQNS